MKRNTERSSIKLAKTGFNNLIINDGVLIKVKDPELMEGYFECPEGIIEIADCAFIACRKVTKIHLPDTINCIGSNAFQSCKELKYINFPKNLTVVATSTFYNCNLTAIDLPEQVISVGYKAFGNCNNLSHISLYKNIQSINQYAFCMMLEYLPQFVILNDGNEDDLQRIRNLLPAELKDRLISKPIL